MKADIKDCYAEQADFLEEYNDFLLAALNGLVHGGQEGKIDRLGKLIAVGIDIQKTQMSDLIIAVYKLNDSVQELISSGK